MGRFSLVETGVRPEPRTDALVHRSLGKHFISARATSDQRVTWSPLPAEQEKMHIDEQHEHTNRGQDVKNVLFGFQHLAAAVTGMLSSARRSSAEDSFF
jgi:hypothetical protein